MASSYQTFPRRRTLRLEMLEPRELLTLVMTPQEQLFIELVNRARADPTMEALRYDIDLNAEVEEDSLISDEPKQPLAPHQALINAAGLHSEDMLRRDFFGHDTPEGITPSDRAKAAGYPRGAGENIAWFGETQGINRDREVYERHRGLFLSVGHRVNMMRDTWQEIGAGVRYGQFRQVDDGQPTNFNSIMVGTLFGSRGGNAFITGVTISDRVVPNDFYEIGEGLGGVSITAVREGSGESFTDVTGISGGYTLQVPAGAYTITAVGGLVRSPITVRGVQISDTNRKIDFNTRNMPTGDIAGQVYHDQNGDGRRDPGDPTLPNWLVYLDLDASGTFEIGEPNTTSTTNGAFVFTDVWPGQYDVRQQLPEGWRETAPDGTFAVTLGGNNDAVGLQFGAQTRNEPPQAQDDVASVSAGASIVIDVLGNDTDPDGSLAPETIQITTEPVQGSVTINAARGELTYRAAVNFSGADSFRYTVADDAGARSTPATVRVTVTSSKPLQNTAEPRDVDADGVVVALDALLVIRELNLNGTTVVADRNFPAGPPYFDVNGDGVISPLDALQIIRALNRR